MEQGIILTQSQYDGECVTTTGNGNDYAPVLSHAEKCSSISDGVQVHPYLVTAINIYSSMYVHTRVQSPALM